MPVEPSRSARLAAFGANAIPIASIALAGYRRGMAKGWFAERKAGLSGSGYEHGVEMAAVWPARAAERPNALSYDAERMRPAYSAKAAHVEMRNTSVLRI
jgi:hypothetical protein